MNTTKSYYIATPEAVDLHFRKYCAEMELMKLLPNKLTGKEYSSLLGMIKSDDEENLVVAEYLIKILAL